MLSRLTDRGVPMSDAKNLIDLAGG